MKAQGGREQWSYSSIYSKAQNLMGRGEFHASAALTKRQLLQLFIECEAVWDPGLVLGVLKKIPSLYWALSQYVSKVSF
jgi:hypothetical protein